MNPALLKHITQIMEQGSKSFASVTRLFDTATRHSTMMLYAWCRYCDDIIDGQELGKQISSVDKHSAREKLQMLQYLTRQAYDGLPMTEPAFAAFQIVALSNEIPQQQAFEHLEGFAMDVLCEPYRTLDDTLRYCYHVAGVVGLMMARVMGIREASVLDRACDLGIAFQLTNIARDIIEDAKAGRCYLPLEWLYQEGLMPDTLIYTENRPALARVASRLIVEAESYYTSALTGLVGLPLRSAWVIASAHGIYREIGIKVQQAGVRAWERRQRTNRGEKVTLLMVGAMQALMSRVAITTPRDPKLWQRPH
ncbi:15-cis-phytoene synthase CrtB [Photorhabdus akhurstii]|uniref:15-cis-phytoene synthase CrtB n=1 Tax=Photorhabdus akhurstii TaxID=171438 RepID=UPI003703E194